MCKKEIMKSFFKLLSQKKLITLFIKELFNYDNFNDYNYIYRMSEKNNSIIIDIYDNISSNRFNRYIFSFKKSNYDYQVEENNNVFVSYINILNTKDSSNKLLKLGYLFNIRKNKMIEYASSFLDSKIVECLKDVLKKDKSI